VNSATSSNYLSVRSWRQFNTTFAYDVLKNTTVRFIANNVFDREPPFPALAGTQGNFAAATEQYFSGIIRRTYLLNVEAKF